MELGEAIGTRIKHYRKQAGLTQEDLGFEANLHRTYISLLERGKNTPSLETFFILCQILNVEPSVIIAETTDLLKKK